MLPKEILNQSQKVCPQCKASDVIKHGKTRKGEQVYLCKPCRKTFTLSRLGIMPKRRMPPEQVGAAIGMFYSGMSISEIARHLGNIFEIPPPSKATIYEWINDYTRLALNALQTRKARTGDSWVADEMAVKVGGEQYWNWNVMDEKTRFILASHLSKNRGTRDAVALFEKARENALTTPETIKTDRLKSYIDGIEQVFGADTKHIQSQDIKAKVNNNLSERLQGTFRQRTKVLRGLQSRQTGQLFLDGWVLTYNYFRAHEAINKTPAEAAGLRVPYQEWEDFARLDVRPFSQVRLTRTTRRKNPLRSKRL